MRTRSLFRKAIAWPSDHGSWVFLISPLVIGLAAGGRWSTPCLYLIAAALAGFLIRQPTTVAVKALSGRRSRSDLPAAIFWSLVYGGLGGIHVIGLILRGFGALLYLGIPGLIVFCWYLLLVAQRQERGQIALEILAAGVLALTAPAGFWVGIGRNDPQGWLLWALAWLQATASILHVYLRLDQRRIRMPGRQVRWSAELPALTVSSINVLLVAALGIQDRVGIWLFLAFLPQWIEVIVASFRPSIETKPARIGMRQLLVSSLFTILFILLWH